MASPITEGATALKLENEVQQETMTEAEQPIDSDEIINEGNSEETKPEGELHDDMQEQESNSNGLENFEIEEETPGFFNLGNEENLSDETSTSKESDNLDEDDLEIPAFLRRQKN